ncbi:MAG: DUF4365 domain-containing protein [Cyanobacteria bacterium J06641_5]
MTIGLYFQLKASTRWEIEGAEIAYDLEAKTYNDLIALQTGIAPCILILLALPREQSRWLQCEESTIAIGGCCYWVHLTGKPTLNKSSQRISIPQQQRFTPDTLLKLLAWSKARQDLP